MTDTQYFEQAVNEYCLQRSVGMATKVGDLTMAELSMLLRRAQELKTQGERQHVLERMGV